MSSSERKQSKKRDAILKTLRSTVSHPGAQWVYDQLKPAIPDLSLGTVYRNIALFKKQGNAVSLGVVDGEERFDAVTEPHPHAVCTRCGKIGDMSVTNKTMEGFQKEGIAGNDTGDFIIDFRRTVFYGLCRDCADIKE